MSLLQTTVRVSPNSTKQVERKEKAISLAKEMYEKLGDAERVLIYNKEGVVVGDIPEIHYSRELTFPLGNILLTLLTPTEVASPGFLRTLCKIRRLFIPNLFSTTIFLLVLSVQP